MKRLTSEEKRSINTFPYDLKKCSFRVLCRVEEAIGDQIEHKIESISLKVWLKVNKIIRDHL